jgi:hypothetical protein
MLDLLVMIPRPDDIRFWNRADAGRHGNPDGQELADQGYATGKTPPISPGSCAGTVVPPRNLPAT